MCVVSYITISIDERCTYMNAEENQIKSKIKLITRNNQSMNLWFMLVNFGRVNGFFSCLRYE